VTETYAVAVSNRRHLRPGYPAAELALPSRQMWAWHYAQWRILILASLERASGLLGQLESWNGSKAQGTLTKEDHDAILQRPAPILLWRGFAHQEDVLVHSRPDSVPRIL
jgi:hypothetical protein